MATPQQLLQQARSRGNARPVLSKPVTRPPGGGAMPRGVKVAPAGQGRPTQKPAPQGAGAPPGGQAPSMGRYNPTPVQPGDLGPGSVGPGAGRQELGARSPVTGGIRSPGAFAPPFDPSILPGRGAGVPSQPPGGPPGSVGGGMDGASASPVPPPGALPPRYANMPPEVAAQRFAAFKASQLPGQQQNHVATDIAPQQMFPGFKPMAAMSDAGPGAAPSLTFPPQGGGQPPGVGLAPLPSGGPPGSIGGGMDGAVTQPMPHPPFAMHPPEPPVPGPTPAPSPSPQMGGFQSFGQIGAGMGGGVPRRLIPQQQMRY